MIIVHDRRHEVGFSENTRKIPLNDNSYVKWNIQLFF